MNSLQRILILFLIFIAVLSPAKCDLDNTTETVKKGVLGVFLGSQTFRLCLCKCGVPNEARPNKFSSLTNTLEGLGITNIFGNRSRSLIKKSIITPPVIAEEESKLVGGDLPDDQHRLPWLALIFVNGNHAGGGVLISDRRVLTAASVLLNTGVESVKVSLGIENRCVGDTGAVNHSITDILANPQFDPVTRSHDLAILTLANVVNFGPNVVPICLPKFISHFNGQQVSIASWGGTAPNATVCRPRRIRLPILPKDECARSVTSQSLLTSDKDCLGVVGSPSPICPTDVGYPVQWRGHGGKYELIGIIAGLNTCGTTNSTLQIRIQDHLPWLKLNLRSDCTCHKH